MQRSIYCFLVTGFCLFAGIAPAYALLNEVWVSRVGSDVPICGSALTPCRTLQYAHNAIVVPNGTIFIRDPGNYQPVTITKPINIIGNESWPASIQQATLGASAISINAGPNDKIFIKGLVLDGVDSGGSGISLQTGSLELDHMLIRGFRDAGIWYVPNQQEDSYIKVSESKISKTGSFYFGNFTAPQQGCGAYISSFQTQHPKIKAVFDRVDLDRNISGMCVQAANGIDNSVTIIHSNVHGNSRDGIWTDNLGTDATLHLVINDTSISDNGGENSLLTGAGVLLNGRTTARISNSVITNNWTGVFVNVTATLESFGNNVIFSNGVDFAGKPVTPVALR